MPGYIRKNNPQCDGVDCTFDNCCEQATPFNGIPITHPNDNCDNKCFNSEDKCSNVNRKCNIIIPTGQNKTIVSNDTNITLSLYEKIKPGGNPPTDVNTCCKSNGSSNPFGKGCKWQQGDNLFNCGCYQYFEPNIETDIVTLMSNDTYGNITTYTPNLNYIINTGVKKTFNKKLKKDEISEMNGEELPTCYNKDNSDIQSCANTSQKLGEYGYDGCMWNNYKLY